MGLARAGWCCRRSTPAGRTRAASPPAASCRRRNGTRGRWRAGGRTCGRCPCRGGSRGVSMRRLSASSVAGSVNTRRRDAGVLVVDPGVEERRRVHEVVAARVEVGEAHRGHRAAEADRQRVDGLAAGDLARDVDGSERAQAQVVVEREVADRRVGVAEADRERRVPVVDGPLDQALPRRQVGDVVAVDPRRDHQQRRANTSSVFGSYWSTSISSLRNTTAPRRGRGVLPSTNDERSTWLGQPSLLTHVVHEVAQAAHEAGAAGLERALQRARVAEHEVGGRQRVAEDAGGELGLRRLAPLEPAGAHELLEQTRGEQVEVEAAVVQDVVGPRGVAEAARRAGRGGRPRATDGRARGSTRWAPVSPRPTPYLATAGTVRHGRNAARRIAWT